MERTTGALLGAACGDALGAPIEFMDPLTVRRRYGKITGMMGGGPWAPGEWTDDTGMALCVAEGILDDPADPVTAAGRRLVEWSQIAKDVGPTVGAVLVGFRKTGDWAAAAESVPQARLRRAAGNGSLKRTLPVALAYADREALLTASARLSAMTHWDPQAEVCCGLYCLWIRELLAGAEVGDAWETAVGEARRQSAGGQLASDTPGPSTLPEGFWERFDQVQAKRYEELQASGFARHCVECLEAVAWCCLHADGAEMAVLDAVNLAGEADTIGALAGGVAGARWGAGSLPGRWLDPLRGRDRLEEIGRRLERLRLG